MIENLGQRLCIYEVLTNQMKHVVLFIIIGCMASLVDQTRSLTKYHFCRFSTLYFGNVQFWFVGHPVVVVFNIRKTRFCLREFHKTTAFAEHEHAQDISGHSVQYSPSCFWTLSSVYPQLFLDTQVSISPAISGHSVQYSPSYFWTALDA